MKNIRKTLNPFFIYDRTGMQNYLEEQAQKGWMLDKITALGWQFHRMEPKKIHYSVVYFAGASDFDPEPSEELLLFREFCEHTGWKLAAANAQMQVFCNEEEEKAVGKTQPQYDHASDGGTVPRSGPADQRGCDFRI